MHEDISEWSWWSIVLVLTASLSVLKLTGFLVWSWWIVTAPVSGFLLMGAIVALMLGLVELLTPRSLEDDDWFDNLQ